MLALAEDHRNDIVSNLGAIAFGAIASISPKVWWFDPVGAILISAYIIWSWACILKGQVCRARLVSFRDLLCSLSRTGVSAGQRMLTAEKTRCIHTAWRVPSYGDI